jgi:hypothetical protein
MAPQVGLERDPEIATARTILLNFRSDTRKINTYTGFDLYQHLPQKSLKTDQITGRQYKSSTFLRVDTGEGRHSGVMRGGNPSLMPFTEWLQSPY